MSVCVWLADTKDILVMLSDMDINAIAGTLKLYFRELPEPLLTDRLYPAFMEGIGATFELLHSFQEVCVCLEFCQSELQLTNWRRWGLLESRLAIIGSDIFFLPLSQLSQTQQPRRTAWCTSCARCLTPTSWPSSRCWSTSNGTKTRKYTHFLLFSNRTYSLLSLKKCLTCSSHFYT